MVFSNFNMSSIFLLESNRLGLDVIEPFGYKTFELIMGLVNQLSFALALIFWLSKLFLEELIFILALFEFAIN